MSYFDKGHPYRWRTGIRGHLPWFLIDLGLADKAEDCESVGATQTSFAKVSCGRNDR